jgi:uncharacterized protein GlcG (DUF336 family)
MTQTKSQTLTKKTISASLCQSLIDAAIESATDIEVPMVISIVDDAGNLKAFHRMDSAPGLSIQISQDKAYTAVAFGIPTHDWFDFIKDDPPLLHGIVKASRLMVFGGGYPITVDGEAVGGIGLSGGHYSQDMQVAEAALNKLGLANDG